MSALIQLRLASGLLAAMNHVLALPGSVCCLAARMPLLGAPPACIALCALKVVLSVYCVGESHNPTPQCVALT